MISIVVGGYGGIGSDIVEVLKNRGDNVYTLSRRNSKEEDHLSIDLESKDSINKLDEKFLNINIDNLIFCHRYRGSDHINEYKIIVDGASQLVEIFKDKFTKNGSIVFLNSPASLFHYDEVSIHYHAARAALDGIMRFYTQELGSKGIRCNSILIGTIVKKGNKGFFKPNNPVRKLIEEITPLKTIGDSRDISNLVEYLCSNKSSFISGQSINIDGGLSVIGQETIARRLRDLKH